VPNRKGPQWLLPLALLLFGLSWFSLEYSSRREQPKQVSYSEFLSEVRSGRVAELGIEEQLFTATLKTEPTKKEAAQQIATQRLPSIDETSLLADLEAQHVTFSGHITKASWWSALLPWVLVSVRTGCARRTAGAEVWGKAHPESCWICYPTTARKTAHEEPLEHLSQRNADSVSSASRNRCGGYHPQNLTHFRA
jgi:hypothetical protein